MKKGYVVTWDAIIALSFVLFLMLGFIGLNQSSDVTRRGTNFDRLHSVAENALDTINKRGVLEEIGYYWTQGNTSFASNLTRDTLDLLIPKNIGYRLEIVDGENVTVIYESNLSRPLPQDAADQTRAVRMMSGYEENISRTGWAARAWARRRSR